MKKFILPILLSLFAALPAGAQVVKSKLESATIFRAGAELTHTARVSVVSGTNNITIEGLSSQINLNSLTIKCSDNVTVMSNGFAQDFVSAKPQTDVVKRLRDSIAIYDKELAALKIKQGTADNMSSILMTNMTRESAEIDIVNLTKMMDYYKTKSIEINTERELLLQKAAKVRVRRNILNAELKKEQGGGDKRTGKLDLVLAAPLAKSVNIEIGYFTSSASWTPFYDIQASGPDKPLTIVSKAHFTQTTGLDWDKVKITLSTTMPNSGRTAPVLKAWFVSSAVGPRMLADNVAQNRMSYSKITMADMEGIPSTSASDAIYGTMSAVSITDSSKPSPKPIFIVDGVVTDASIANSISSDMIESKTTIAGLQAVVQYGEAASGGATVIVTRRSFVTAGETSAAEATYAIDLPYNLLANGSKHTVTLRTMDVPATFEYYSVPQIDKTVYLLASIKDWAQYNLIAGEANITYDGTYAGKTMINPYSTGETLHLTLGQDKGVVVSREKMQDFSKTRFVGNEKRQSLNYKLTVRNTKNIPINVILKEQYPISTQSGIVIELERTDSAHNNTEVGTLTWEFKLDAGATKSVQAGYMVRAPKDFVLR